MTKCPEFYAFFISLHEILKAAKDCHLEGMQIRPGLVIRIKWLHSYPILAQLHKFPGLLIYLKTNLDLSILMRNQDAFMRNSGNSFAAITNNHYYILRQDLTTYGEWSNFFIVGIIMTLRVRIFKEPRFYYCAVQYFMISCEVFTGAFLCVSFYFCFIILLAWLVGFASVFYLFAWTLKTAKLCGSLEL